MGAGNFDVQTYQKQAIAAKVCENSGFTAKSMCDEFNPAKVSMRFSKKGPFNEFRDVITVLIGLDVTGSMDIIPKSLLQGKLGSLMVDLKMTFNRPNENLQISFAGVGDAKSDSAPLQVTHFESDNRFAQQLQKIWLEGGGGANGAESYNLLWWYAANKTHLNYINEDKHKGILITIGDDNVHPCLTANEIQMWLDPNYEGGEISNQVLLKAVREQYEVYHIVITDGQAYSYDYLKGANKPEAQRKSEAKQWKELLGENNVIHSKSEGVANAIAEIIKQHRPDVKANMANLEAKEWERQNKVNLTDQQWKEVLSYTLCLLTGKFMENPMELADSKRAYEKEAIEKHLSQYKTDPVTHKKLTSSQLTLKLNSNIAQLCANYKPFFDALSEDRKKRLVQLTLADKLPAEDKKAEEIGRMEINSAPEKIIGKTDFFKEKPVNMPTSLAVLSKDSDNVPDIFLCPISQEVMEEPVMAQDGYSYERKNITQWFNKHHTSPMTNEHIDTLLTPNHRLRSEIKQWKDNLASSLINTNKL